MVELESMCWQLAAAFQRSGWREQAPGLHQPKAKPRGRTYAGWDPPAGAQGPGQAAPAAPAQPKAQPSAFAQPTSQGAARGDERCNPVVYERFQECCRVFTF